MNLVTDILLACAAGLTLAWLVAAQRRLVARAARRFVALPRVEQSLLVVAVGVMTVCAQKSGTNGVQGTGNREQGTSAVAEASFLSANPCESVQSVANIESESLSNNTCSLFHVPCSLSTNDIARCFALTRVGTNEVFDFTAPEGANYATNWMLHGGATARTRLRFDDWTFPFGDGCLTNLTAFMFGVIAPDLYNEEKRIAPLQASLGFVAASSFTNPCQSVQSVANIVEKSAFWSLLTPSNSLIITWQNVLLHRLPENPVSFQGEFFANGDFTYRYDFSRLPSDAVLTNAYVIAAPGIGEPFVLSRDEPLEGECLSPTLDRALTSLTFRRLESDDMPGADRDGDGLTTEEELFVYGTDLGLADTSGDGLSDGEAVAQGLDPLARNATDAEILSSVAASATNAAFASATTIDEGSLAAWTLFDGFAADVAAGSTNVLWERTLAVNRTSAWQQFFVSSEKDAAGAWMLEGLRLEWEAPDGSSGSLSRSPVGDSFRIPLSTNEVSTITLRLRATGATSVRSVKSSCVSNFLTRRFRSWGDAETIEEMYS